MGTSAEDDLSRTQGLPTRSALPADAGEGSLARGARLGRYRIDGLLGRGGMGEVYRAEQLEPVLRTVALKVMNARRLDARHLAYFEVERQLLAQMKHPAIAQVFDAGATPDGHPFFAMEFIEGSPLTTYCEQNKLPLRARLLLFARVCEGVQHAHQKGVIHRDLKPGNILVSDVDGRALPKIIDFGIATAASRSLAAGERPGGLERAGTPDYMSPEQAGLDPGAEVDTRSDVYSLGVLLYELLAGRRPGAGIDTDRAAVTASATTVPPPSAQIDTLAPGNADARADQLGLSTPRMRRLLRGELDWIVLKAMRRDRGERYASAAALADDLHRFLDDQPLAAVPASRRYVLGKYLRRHRIGFAAAAAVALAVLAGLGMSLYGLQQARQQRALAEQRSAELERVAAFQQAMLEDVDIEAMGVGLAGGLREQIAKTAPDKLPLLEDLLASASPPDLARQLVGRNVLGGAQAAIERDFADQPALAAGLRLAVGQVQQALGLSAEAAATFAQVAGYHEGAAGAGDAHALAARNLQADALLEAGQVDAAVAVNDQVLARTVAAPAGDAARLDAERTQAVLVFTAGDRPRARALQQALYDREKARRDPADPLLPDLQQDLALTMARMGDIADARAIYEAVYAQRLVTAPDDDKTLATMGRLAVMRAMDGDPEDAVPLQRERVAIAERRQGAEHPQTLVEKGNLANMLLDVRAYDEAEALMRGVLDARARLFGADAAMTVRQRLNLASLLARRQRYAEALAMEDEVLAARRRLLGPRHPDTVFIETNHAMTSHRAGLAPAVVQAQLDIARPLAHAVLGEAHPQTKGIDFIQALTWLRAGDYAQATTLLRELRAQSRADAEEGDTPNAKVGWALATALERSGHAAEAAQVRAEDVQWLYDLAPAEREPEDVDTLDILAEEAARLDPAD